MAANKNEFRNDPDRYPVEADLPIRFGDNSFIEFKFIASGPVAPGNVLEIQGPAGYRFVPDFFQLRDMGPEGFCPPPKPGDEGCAYPYLSLTVNRILDNGMDQPRLILTMDTKDEIWLKMYRTINMVTVEKKEYDATDPANVYLLERGLIGDDLVVDVNATEVTNVLPPPSSMPDNQIYFGRRYALQARVQGPQQAAPPPNHQFQIKFTTLVAVNNGEYPNDLGPSPDFNMTHCIPFRISKSILAFHDPDITYPLEWQSFVAADSFLDVKLEFPRKFPQDLGLTNLEVYPPSSGFFLPRGQIFSDRQEYLPLQFASITVNKIRPFTAPVEINGTTLYPATKYVQAPGGVNLKLVCDRNDSTPINKDVEPVQNYHWYIIGNAKNPTTGVVSTLGWERYEPKDLLVSQFPVQWNPETKWIAGSQVEAMFEIKFRIPLPVGGAIYIKAPPNYRFRCPITNIMVPEPSYMPICVFNPIHPLLQGCGRIERDLQQVTFDINRLENRIEYLKELSKIKPQEMTPQQRLTFISETVNGTRRELDVKMLYKRELEEIMEYVPPPSSETDSTTITTLTITSTASGGFSITNTPPTTTTTEPPTTLPPNGLATTAKPEGKPPSGCELRHEVLFAYQTTDYPPVFYETKMTRSIRDPITGIRQERSQQVAIPIMTYKFNIRMELPEADAQLPNSNRYNDFDVIMLDRMKRTIDNNVAVPVPQFYTDYKVTNFTFWYDHERTRFRTQEENKVINGIDEAYDPRGKIIPFYVTIAINERIPAGRGFKVMEFTVPDNGFGMEIALPTDVQVLSEAVPVRSWGWDPNSARIKQLFFNMPDIDDIDYNGIPAGQFAFSIPMKLPDTTEAIYGLQGNNIQEFTSQDRNGEYMNFFKVKFCNDFPFCIEKLAEFKVPGFQFNDVTRDDFIVQPDGFGSEKYSRTTDRVVKTLADFQVDEGPQSSGATSRRGIKWSSISGILAGGGIWWLGTTLMVALSYSHHVHAVA
ncbi:unnamed protein product [Amoebophrya sp. A120]|nr:unnamed protein product [Amoebophrya sp. A120]|eukprot:GSA120T00013538001.1